jgi:cysteine synthase A
MTQALPSNNRFVQQVHATPLIPVTLDDGPPIWCKLEFMNPSGSTKDRIARYMLEKAWRRGDIGPGCQVVEASSGSTSIALALMAAQMGLRFVAVMPEGVSRERTLMITAYGGQVELTPAQDGILGAMRRAEQLASQGAYYTRQFDNPDNVEAHRVWTGQEILSQIPCGVVDAVVAGVGTGGTIVGLYNAFREAGCPTLAVAARPFSGEAVGGELECCSFAFSKRIPGVVECVSKLYRTEAFEALDELQIQDRVALDTTRKLIQRGFPVGPSSGLNYAAAVATARRLGPAARVVTIFPDRMERYFSTELFAQDLEQIGPA